MVKTILPHDIGAVRHRESNKDNEIEVFKHRIVSR